MEFLKSCQKIIIYLINKKKTFNLIFIYYNKKKKHLYKNNQTIRIGIQTHANITIIIINYNQWNHILFPDCIISITQLSHNPNNLTIFIENTKYLIYFRIHKKKNNWNDFALKHKLLNYDFMIHAEFFSIFFCFDWFFFPLFFETTKFSIKNRTQFFCDTHQQNAHFNSFKNSVKDALWILKLKFD